MAQHDRPYDTSALAREIARVRQRRAVLTTEDHMFPVTDVGYRHMKTKLEREAQAAAVRNKALLQLVEQACSDVSTPSTAHIQLMVLRQAYLSMVRRAYNPWLQYVQETSPAAARSGAAALPASFAEAIQAAAHIAAAQHSLHHHHHPQQQQQQQVAAPYSQQSSVQQAPASGPAPGPPSPLQQQLRVAGPALTRLYSPAQQPIAGRGAAAASGASAGSPAAMPSSGTYPDPTAAGGGSSISAVDLAEMRASLDEQMRLLLQLEQQQTQDQQQHMQGQQQQQQPQQPDARYHLQGPGATGDAAVPGGVPGGEPKQDAVAEQALDTEDTAAAAVAQRSSVVLGSWDAEPEEQRDEDEQAQQQQQQPLSQQQEPAVSLPQHQQLVLVQPAEASQQEQLPSAGHQPGMLQQGQDMAGRTGSPEVPPQSQTEVENTPQPAHGQQQQQQHQHQQQRHASSVPGPAAAVVAAADMAAAMEAATSSSSDVSGDDLEGVSEAEGSALSLPGLSTGPAEAAHGAQAAAAAGGSRGVHVAELQGAPGQGSWPEQVQLAARGRQELGGVDSYDDTGSEDAGSEAEEGPINVRAVSAEASSAAGVSDDGSAAATAEPATSGAMRDSAAEGATSVPAAAQQQQPQSVQPAPPARTNPSAAPPLLMPSLMGVNPWGDAGASSSMASGPGVQALGLPPGVMYRGSSAGGARASVGGGAAGGTLSVPGPRSSTGGGAAGVPMLSPGSRLSLGESLAGSGRPSLSTEHSEDPRLSLGGVSQASSKRMAPPLTVPPHLALPGSQPAPAPAPAPAAVRHMPASSPSQLAQRVISAGISEFDSSPPPGKPLGAAAARTPPAARPAARAPPSQRGHGAAADEDDDALLDF